MATDNEERLDYAHDVLPNLFPGGLVSPARGSRPDPDARSFAVLPAPAYPRLLVTANRPVAARAALRAYGGRLSRGQHAGFATYNALLAAPGSKRLLRPRMTVAPVTVGIDGHLGTAIGRTVDIAVHLTSSRANRKPIIAVLADQERYPVAYAKLGITELAASLVRTETAALHLLQGRSTGLVVVPKVLADDAFDGQPLVVLEALPTWRAGNRLPTLSELAVATADLARSVGSSSATLAESRYWQGQREAINALTTPVVPALNSTADVIERAAGSMEFELGAFHGDWTPWNLRWIDDHLLAWDWERFAVDVPMGCDLVHYRLHGDLVTGRPLLSSAVKVLQDAPDLIAPIVADRRRAKLVAALHLMSLAIRYETDQQDLTAGAIGRVDEWLLPAINTELAAAIAA